MKFSWSKTKVDHFIMSFTQSPENEDYYKIKFTCDVQAIATKGTLTSQQYLLIQKSSQKV